MSSAADLTIEDALETLVNQFADPMAFFRELIQNSIDAGSPEIDIWLDYEATGPSGLLTVQVQDYGEGMDRTIIDTRLTRLFSSSKDGDFTKIGRFGIGFVSVFAIQPDAVCVDTARGGEAWRVLFKADRTFERLRLDAPVEGTLVRVFKTMSLDAYEAFAARAREVVTYWCKHAASEIRFMDEPVNQPFDLPGEPKVVFEEQGTRAVATFSEQPRGSYGFYNRGLTLHEGPSEGNSDSQRVFFPHVSFKIDSRYLEHTLTRDNVLRDTHFDKAMAIIERMVHEQLTEELIRLLEDRQLTGQRRDALYRMLGRWVTHAREREHTVELPQAVRRHRHAEIFFDTQGQAVTLAQVQEAAEDGELYYENEPSPLSPLLLHAGKVVLPLTGGLSSALASLFGKSRAKLTHASYCTALSPTAPEHESWRPLQESLTQLLKAYGAKVRQVRLGHLTYPGSSVKSRVVITQGRLGELTPLAEASQLATSFFSKRRTVVVNADHPTVEKLIQLAPKEPEVAAYLTAKLFFLHDELTPQIDSTLATCTMELRCRRLNIS